MQRHLESHAHATFLHAGLILSLEMDLLSGRNFFMCSGLSARFEHKYVGRDAFKAAGVQKRNHRNAREVDYVLSHERLRGMVIHDKYHAATSFNLGRAHSVTFRRAIRGHLESFEE